MGVESYSIGGRMYWKVDEWIDLPDGKPFRLRKKKIPTKELALNLVTKKKAEAFEGRFFDKVRTPTITVGEVWALYESVSKRDNDSWQTDKGRAEHLKRHLGGKRAVHLNQADVDAYRDARSKETTKRGKAPSPATLDREIELLKRMLNYAVTCKKIPNNPVAQVALLRKPNVRRRMLTEEQFQQLLKVLEVQPGDTEYAARVKLVFRAIVMTAYDTGERKMEILNLKRSQLHIKDGGYIDLAPQDTKTDEGRRVYLTRRTIETLQSLPADIRSEHVFINPETGKAYRDIRKLWTKYLAEAHLPTDTWFHDNRRAYITNCRRRGIDERTIMRQSGHKTRSAFDRYNIVDDNDQRAAVRQYEAALSGHVLDTPQSEADSGKTKAPDFSRAFG